MGWDEGRIKYQQLGKWNSGKEYLSLVIIAKTSTVVC